MESVKVGIKEVKEVQVAVNEIAIFIISRVKDGIQLADGAALVEKVMSDAEFKAKVGAAIENIKAVPAEISDLDISEGMELAIAQIAYVPKLVEAFKTVA